MDSQDKAEATVGFFARMVISAVVPIWGIAMLMLGVARVSPWWVLCGLVTAAVGMVLAVGNPSVWPIVYGPQAGPPRS